jgi:hypothetical protein
MSGTLYEDQYKFMIISLSFLLRMRDVADKVVKKKIRTHILYSVTFFFLPKIVPFMRCGKNIVEPGSPQLTIWHMRFACWITKATNTHSEYVIILAFLLQRR